MGATGEHREMTVPRQWEHNQTGGGNWRPIDRLDAAFTREADDWANRCQARTSVSRQTITFVVYLVAGVAAFAYATLTGQVLFLGVAILAYAGSMPGKQRGSLVEEIQLEAAGLPARTLKYLSVFMLGLGLFGIFSSVLQFALAVSSPDQLLSGFEVLVGGLALTALKVGDYIARTNPSRPNGDRVTRHSRAWLPQARPVS